MPVKIPSYSKLVVNTVGVGVPELSGSRSDKTIDATSSLVASTVAPVTISDRSNKTITRPLADAKSVNPRVTSKVTAPTRDPETNAFGDPTSLVRPTSAVEESIPVYEYDSTIYDTEITGSGATSAYPLILATMPFKNLFKSGELTNFGQLYEIQNELRDNTISSADQLVENYMTAFPDISASLEQTSNTNLNKYSTLVKVLPQVYRLKEDLISTADITSLSTHQLDEVEILGSTTFADSAPTSITSTRTSATVFSSTSTISSSTSGDSNLTVAYTDDDVQKYDNDLDVVTRLTEKFLGVNRPSQLKTTRQYQLLKAALAQCVEGRTFSNIEDEGDYESPYTSLKPYDIASLYSVTSKKITPVEGFFFAKKTLNDASNILSNNYLPTKSYSTGNSFNTDLRNSGLFYKGKINKSKAGIYSIALSSAAGNFLDNDTFLYELLSGSSAEDVVLRNMPVLTLNNKYYVTDFINQIIPVLASDISNEISQFPELPPSIDPYAQTAVDVPSTQNDDIRLITVSDDEQKIFLFDNNLTDRVGTYASPLSSVMLFDIDKIKKMKDDIDNIQLSLQNMVEKRKQLISNQCALTITSIFYKKLYNFFTSYILGTGPISALSSDVRADDAAPKTEGEAAVLALTTIMFARAANDNFAAARLFRIIYDNENEITNLINQGEVYNDSESSESDYASFVNDLLTTPTGREDSNPTPLERGDLLTGRSTTDNISINYGKDVFNKGLTTKYEKEIKEYELGNFLNVLYSEKSVFNTVCRAVVDEVVNQYPTIASNKNLISKIRFGFFHMLLYYVRKLRIRATGIANLRSSKKSFDFTVILEWQKEGSLFLADSFNEAITKSSANNLSFTNYKKQIGDFPTADQIQAGSEEFFRRIRGHVKYTLQITQDLKALIAYQITVLKAQSNTIASLTELVNKISDLYGGDNKKASQILARYGTVESITEILYQANRNLTLIPGTSISSTATRSQNYRSIVKMAFKNYIPKKDNFLLCLIGIPYGHLERLRLAQSDRIYYYGCNVFADSSQVDEQNRVDYDFPYYSITETARPNTAGPHLSTIPNLYDDVLSTRIVEKMSDDAISIMRLSDAGDRLDILSHDEANPKTQAIDFPATIVQSALQSYIEDIYGLYPRYASTKGKRLDSYPEERIADAVLQFNNIENSTDEQKLIYARLKSVIMMHRLFMTTRFIDDLEASPLFDKIHYVLVDGNKFKDLISEFYTKVEV